MVSLHPKSIQGRNSNVRLRAVVLRSEPRTPRPGPFSWGSDVSDFIIRGCGALRLGAADMSRSFLLSQTVLVSTCVWPCDNVICLPHHGGARGQFYGVRTKSLVLEETPSCRYSPATCATAIFVAVNASSGIQVPAHVRVGSNLKVSSGRFPSCDTSIPLFGVSACLIQRFCPSH